MKKEMKLEVRNPFFSTKQIENAVMLRFEKNVLIHSTNFDHRDTLHDYLDQLSQDKTIKTLVIRSSSEQAGCEEYTKFILNACARSETFDIQRYCNFINQLILHIMDLNQIVIHAARGNVIAVFHNISMACDYRIATDDTIFCNPYLDLDILPKGGGPFFLSKMLGTGKAYEVLLSREITAARALQLGIIDRMAAQDKFEEMILETVRFFGDRHRRLLTGMKRLMNYHRRDMEAYLELENQEVYKIFDSPCFKENWPQCRRSGENG